MTANDKDMMNRLIRRVKTKSTAPDPELYAWLETHYPDMLKLQHYREQIVFELKQVRENAEQARNCPGTEDEKTEAVIQAIQAIKRSDKRSNITMKALEKEFGKE